MAAADGGYHSAAVGEDGALFVWGSGEDGQLGMGDTDRRLAPTPATVMAPCSLHAGVISQPCWSKLPANPQCSLVNQRGS